MFLLKFSNMGIFVGLGKPKSPLLNSVLAQLLAALLRNSSDNRMQQHEFSPPTLFGVLFMKLAWLFFQTFGHFLKTKVLYFFSVLVKKSPEQMLISIRNANAFLNLL